MKSLKTVEPLVNRLLDIQRINSAASVLSWDQPMPAGGGYCAEQIATFRELRISNWCRPTPSGSLAHGLISRRAFLSNRTGNSGTNRPTPCA